MSYEPVFFVLQRGACLLAGLALCLGNAEAGEEVHIAVHDEAVTIEAANATIREVLEALSERTGLAVTSQAALDERVSVTVDRAALPTAVRRLLRYHSFLMQEIADGSGVLRVFADDKNKRAIAWATPERSKRDYNVASDLTDYQMISSSANAADRAEAMFAIGEQGGSANTGYLLMGLHDPAYRVREEAIAALADIGGKESVRLLGLALGDTSIRVRLDAVDALGDIGGPEALALLQRAASDPDPAVREAASERLLEWQ